MSSTNRLQTFEAQGRSNITTEIKKKEIISSGAEKGKFPKKAELTSEQKALSEGNRLAAMEKLKLLSEKQIARKASNDKMRMTGTLPCPVKTVAHNRMQPYMKPQNRFETGPATSSRALVNKTMQNVPQAFIHAPVASTSNYFQKAQPSNKPNTAIVQLEMITENRFAAKLDSKNDIVINKFRKINSRTYSKLPS